MNKQLPAKDDIRRTYEEYRPIFKALLAGLENKLKECLRLISMPTFKTRVKKFDSYYRKLLRLNPVSFEQKLVALTDMIGIRVICPFLEDIGTVEKQIIEILRFRN